MWWASSFSAASMNCRTLKRVVDSKWRNRFAKGKGQKSDDQRSELDSCLPNPTLRCRVLGRLGGNRKFVTHKSCSSLEEEITKRRQKGKISSANGFSGATRQRTACETRVLRQHVLGSVRNDNGCRRVRWRCLLSASRCVCQKAGAQ